MNEMSLSRRKFLKGTAGTMAIAAAGISIAVDRPTARPVLRAVEGLPAA